jgi:hypothetical protein
MGKDGKLSLSIAMKNNANTILPNHFNAIRSAGEGGCARQANRGHGADLPKLRN